MQKFKKFKKKIINFLMEKGEKATVEQNFTHGLKKFQKISKKETKAVLKTVLISTVTPFKILSFEQKKRKKKEVKEVPFFIKTSKERIIFAIKNFTKALKNQPPLKLYKKISEELFQETQQNLKTAKIKTEIQIFIRTKKRLLKNYKW